LSLSLWPQTGEKAPPPAFFEPDEPGIPTGSYELLELYCPNPECPCLEAMLQVFPPAAEHPVASIRVSLDPAEKPILDWIPMMTLFRMRKHCSRTSPGSKQQSGLSVRLRAHYDQVKAVAADPSHPAHSTMIKWAITGGPTPR